MAVAQRVRFVEDGRVISDGLDLGKTVGDLSGGFSTLLSEQMDTESPSKQNIANSVFLGSNHP